MAGAFGAVLIVWSLTFGGWGTLAAGTVLIVAQLHHDRQPKR